MVDKLKEQLKVPDLKIVYVAVNSQDRFEAIAGNKADLLCKSTTATLARRQTVDFSIPIFIDGASFVIRPDGPRDVKLLAGKKVAVLPGTTTEQELRRALSRHANQCRDRAGQDQPGGHRRWSKRAASRPISPTAPRSPSCCGRRSRRPAC